MVPAFPCNHQLTECAVLMMLLVRITCCFLLGIFSFFGEVCIAEAAKKTKTNSQDEFFEKQVRPLLIAECGKCHGAKKQWADLRTDTREAMIKGGESGPAVVPGKPEESLLISAIRREDFEMPPKKVLNERQIAILDRWVRDGAYWPAERHDASKEAARDHWAFLPLKSVPVPDMNAPWCLNPIDQFVLSKLHEKNLKPAASADRRTLIRRVTYTLTGLPPTYKQTESFLNDTSPDAYAKLVDRLLDSPRYGEHWGRHWLDVARYADTKGYVFAREERFFVHSHLYRDWVIKALNEDLPYDQFLLMQIAADQVDARRPEDLCATGFLNLGRRFLGVPYDIVDDRIDVVMRGTMGLTVACARCHDHKYDPIPTSDYYSLAGIFRNCSDELTFIAESKQKDEAYLAFEKELRVKQKKLQDKLQKSREEVSIRVRNRTTDYLQAQAELEKYPDEAFNQVTTKEDLLPVFVHNWKEYLANAKEQHDPVFIHWHRFAELKPEQFQIAAPAICKELAGASASKVNLLVATEFVVPPKSMKEVAKRYGSLFVKINQQSREIFADPANSKDLQSLFPPSSLALHEVLYGSDSPCLVPDESIASIEYYFDIGTINEIWKLQNEVERWLIYAKVPIPYTVAVKDRKHIRAQRVLRRGNPALQAEHVSRHFLSMIAGEEPKSFRNGSGRLELAQAIIDPRNPLTARVWVNRIWTHHFGEGLVRNPSDFGVRSDPPSHPRLLDWLANQLVSGGWSTKNIHRMILLSATYRQGSRLPEETAMRESVLQQDPDNRLLWRMNPRRLNFEEYRDTLLAISAELNLEMGGRGKDLLAESNHRRTIYAMIDRQFLPTTLRIFDFANPDLHISKRNQTTVPQQALFGMNHPFIAQRTRAINARLSGTHPETKIDEIYQAIYNRNPTPQQKQIALKFISTSEAEKENPIPPETKAWQYGWAKLLPESGELQNFKTLPHFTGTAWQGGEKWPDAKLGWVQLTAQGGHPGNDHQHVAVRRFIAPYTGTYYVSSKVEHAPAVGDGIRCWVISDSNNVLKKATVHHSNEQFEFREVALQSGETLDFVVDINTNLNSDQYLWPIRIDLLSVNKAGDKKGGPKWDSERDFSGPLSRNLSPWEQLTQVLLLGNELMFVD